MFIPFPTCSNIRIPYGNDPFNINMDDLIKGIKKMGVWGFYQYTTPKSICYWAEKSPFSEASIDMIIHFFAHELTHHYHRTLICKKDEEIRAEIVAQICLKAIKLSKKVING